MTDQQNSQEVEETAVVETDHPVYEVLPPSEEASNELLYSQEKMGALVQSINIGDSSSVIAYGAKPMGEIARFADTILTKVRSKDSEELGGQLTELIMKIKGYDPLSLQEKSNGFLSKLPLIGGAFRKADKIKLEFQTLTEQVDGIAKHLDVSMVKLLHDIETLEQLYQKNFDFYKDVSLYVDAGKKKLAEIKSQDLPALELKAKESGDMMDAQKVKDLIDGISRFERRLHDLELSKMVAVQTAPQIRMVQSNNQQLAEKIQSSILSTLPIWKSQMVLSLSLEAQGKAAMLQKDVADTTNELLRKNAEMLQHGSIETATQVERSIVDIETLRETQNMLVNTIEETLKIASEARAKRVEIEKELGTMEEDLRLRLTAATDKYR